MTFDIAKIIESKRSMRKHLAALPIEEKLRMLDQLRDRTKDIDKSTPIQKLEAEGRMPTLEQFLESLTLAPKVQKPTPNPRKPEP